MPNDSGLMLIDKPSGITSHDVVNFLRRKLGTKRIGHTGTLDPNATGLMVMLIGKATLLSSVMIKMDKRYTSRIEFGVTTDTYDCDGKITDTQPPPKMTKSELESILEKYKGDIEQEIPPYSAAKRQGRTMHKLARKGLDVSVGRKVVTIEHINIIAFDWPEVAIDVKCSSGTYIRSLAHQLGQEIGCGGHLKNLRRTEVGGFRLADAKTLDEMADSLSPRDFIKSLKGALPGSPVIPIKPQYLGAVLNGRPLQKKYLGEGNYRGKGGELGFLTGPDEMVLALAKLNQQWPSYNMLGPSDVIGTYIRIIDEGNIRAK